VKDEEEALRPGALGLNFETARRGFAFSNSDLAPHSRDQKFW
jgi:hypothetical protein